MSLNLPKGLRPLKSPAHGQVTMLQTIEKSERRILRLGCKSLKQVFAAILRCGKRDNQNEWVEKDVVALPLTHQELTLVVLCLCVACESARTDAADKRMIGAIRERIGRFAERQGAWWDVEGEIVATVVKTITVPDVAKPLA